jgi:hypothetical protein
MKPTTDVPKEVHQLRKAAAIATVIRRHAEAAYDADPVASAALITTPEARDIVAQLAGCKLNPDTGHYCSPVTWAMAVELLVLGESQITEAVASDRSAPSGTGEAGEGRELPASLDEGVGPGLKRDDQRTGPVPSLDEMPWDVAS